VRAQSQAAADVLTVSAFWAPDRIPFELLVRGAPELGETIAAELPETPEDVSAARNRVRKLLTPLARYSLIERDADDACYNVHRLVQEVVRADLSVRRRRIWAERVVCALNRAFPPIEFENWALCERL